MSPPRQYIPAGAEEDETNSFTSTYEEEETVEEELANYFSNPSYRVAGPPPLEPIDSEEDWGDASPVPLPLQTPQELPQLAARFEKGRGICKEGGKEEDNIGGEEIMIRTT